MCKKSKGTKISIYKAVAKKQQLFNKRVQVRELRKIHSDSSYERLSVSTKEVTMARASTTQEGQ